PTGLRGTQVDLLLEFEGEPLADVLIIAYRRQAPMEKVSVRTDADGAARLELGAGGDWLITAVTISARARGRAQWLSHWAAVHLRVD
ncbi:MAG: hypothetical protein ACPGUC_10285, partial [Gammaproteobacteria bacterium]